LSEVIGLLGSIFGMVFQLAFSIPPWARAFEQMWNFAYPNRLPEPGDIVSMRIMGILNDEQYKQAMRFHGFSEYAAKDILSAARAKLAPELVLRLFRMGYITKEDYDKLMGILGYDSSTATLFELSMREYASLSDLVRFAIREVYTPEIRSKYGLDEDFPAQFEKEAMKIGVPPELARNYWAAHWELPSFEQGLRMLWYGLITRDELKTLLRALDVMPYWRDKLIDISYLPYTRVDIRRMYEMGLVDEAQVKKNYMMLGYDEEHAENLTKFTVLQALESQKDLSLSMIKKAYFNGVIARDQALEHIKKLGYDDANAELILTLAEIEEKDKELEDKAEAIIAQFKAGVIDEVTALTQLDALGVTAKYRDKLIAKAKTEKAKGKTLPSKSDLEKWFMAEIIDEAKLREYLLKLGFTPQDIDFYVKALWLEKLDRQEAKARQENPKLLPRETLITLFVEGTIDESRLRKGLQDLRFSADDVELLVQHAYLKQAEYLAKKAKSIIPEAEELVKELREIIASKA